MVLKLNTNGYEKSGNSFIGYGVYFLLVYQ